MIETKLEIPSEPTFRDQLPWLKDPAQKISLWKVLKDNLGREL